MSVNKCLLQLVSSETGLRSKPMLVVPHEFCESVAKLEEYDRLKKQELVLVLIDLVDGKEVPSTCPLMSLESFVCLFTQIPSEVEK